MEAKKADVGNEMIERYVYAVVRRLPARQRADIRMEILGLADDMLHDRFPGQESEPDSVRAVLIELGHPAILASKYRESGNWLIGPEYIDTYRVVLKIVLSSIFAGMVIAMTFRSIVVMPSDLVKALVDFIASVTSAVIGGFAWVTVIFALVEHFAAPAARKGRSGIEAAAKAWKPEDLPPVPQKKQIIRKSEPIVAILFSVLFLVLLNTSPQIFGVVYSLNAAPVIIPFFDLTHFADYLPLLNGIIILGLLKESLKLLEGRYTVRLSFASVVLGAASLVMTVYILLDPSFWNPDFVREFTSSAHFAEIPGIDLQRIISGLFTGVIILAVFGFLVETLSNFYKAIRYR